MTHFAIIGRINGDDEDTTLLYQDCTEEEARATFIEDLRALDDIDPNDVEGMGEAADVYISHVLASETPITLLWSV